MVRRQDRVSVRTREVVSRVDSKPSHHLLPAESHRLGRAERLEETYTSRTCLTASGPLFLRIKTFPVHTKQEQLSVLCTPLATTVSSEEASAAPFSVLPENPPSTSAFLSILHSHPACVSHEGPLNWSHRDGDAPMCQECGVDSSRSLWRRDIHLSVVELMRFQKTKRVLSKVKRKKSPYPTRLVGARKLRLCSL